jgi:hypothetical protein
MIAAAGSTFGMRGIATIPAPSRPRALADFDDLMRAVCTDRAFEPLQAVAIDGPCGAEVAEAAPQRSQ